MNIILATFYGFLPRRYRDLFTSHSVPACGALLGGIIESLICLSFLIPRYCAFENARLAAVPLSLMAEAGKQGGETAIMGLGSIFMVEYLLQFTTILLIFLTIEGAVRAIAALGGGEALPSLPLFALSLLHTGIGEQGRELRLGRRIPDEAQLTSSGESLQIASCRPKPWDQRTTISYQGELYELVRTSQGLSPRPFLYFLRKKSSLGVIRKLCVYDPDEMV